MTRYDPAPDPERVATLREIATEFQDRGAEAETLGALLYRISDLYDPAETVSTTDIYLAMRQLMRVTEGGGINR